VVEGADLEAELGGHVQHQQHLVGAVAVVLHQDPPAQHLGQRLEAQIARRRQIALGPPLLLEGVPLAPVVLGSAEGRAHLGDVAHARGRAALLAVDALGVLAAGHLQHVGRAREAHAAAERAGRFFTAKPRPPIRLAEPGSTSSEVTPPASARVRPGSCGQKPCSALDLGGVGAGGLVAVGVGGTSGLA
jgi:hypothetical protein